MTCHIYIQYVFGLRIEKGTEMPTIIVDSFDTVQTVRNTSIHLRVDEEQWRIARVSKRQAGGFGTLTYYLSRLHHTDAPHNT